MGIQWNSIKMQGISMEFDEKCKEFRCNSVKMQEIPVEFDENAQNSVEMRWNSLKCIGFHLNSMKITGISPESDKGTLEFVGNAKKIRWNAMEMHWISLNFI